MSLPRRSVASHPLPKRDCWEAKASKILPKLLILLVPVERIELPTFGLQNRCSTAELNRQTRDFDNPADARKVSLLSPAIRNRVGAGGPSNTRLVRQGLQPRNRPGRHVRGRRPDARLHLRRIRSAGEKRHGVQVAVGGCVWVVGFSDLRADRRSRGGPRILQTICPGGAQPGARRTGQSPLRRRPAGRAMVERFCGSLPMVPWCFLWRSRCRARCTDGIFERLPLIGGA